MKGRVPVPVKQKSLQALQGFSSYLEMALFCTVKLYVEPF